MAAAHVLDVSGLPPPEPLLHILDAIERLDDGDYLHVLHHREPFPLYEILNGQGYAWLTRPGRQVPFELFIWRRGDAAAQDAVPPASSTI